MIIQTAKREAWQGGAQPATRLQQTLSSFFGGIVGDGVEFEASETLESDTATMLLDRRNSTTMCPGFRLTMTMIDVLLSIYFQDLMCQVPQH